MGEELAAKAGSTSRKMQEGVRPKCQACLIFLACLLGLACLVYLGVVVAWLACLVGGEVARNEKCSPECKAYLAVGVE